MFVSFIFKCILSLCSLKIMVDVRAYIWDSPASKKEHEGKFLTPIERGWLCASADVIYVPDELKKVRSPLKYAWTSLSALALSLSRKKHPTNPTATAKKNQPEHNGEAKLCQNLPQPNDRMRQAEYAAESKFDKHVIEYADASEEAKKTTNRNRRSQQLSAQDWSLNATIHRYWAEHAKQCAPYRRQTQTQKS